MRSPLCRFRRVEVPFAVAILLAGGPFAPGAARAADPPEQSQPAETVLVGGKILTMDREARIVQAVAVRDGRIAAVGTDRKIRNLAGPKTRVIELNGKTVVPGFIAAHCHAVGVARRTIDQPHAELLSIAEVQDWIRTRAKELPEGRWIRVPRTEITRLEELRHPTRAELDAACTTHPVLFSAARKHALNSAGFRALGVKPGSDELPGGRVIRDADGGPRLIALGDAFIEEQIPKPEHSEQEIRAFLEEVHRRYNSVGITSIFERASEIDDYRMYEALRDAGRLNVRMTQTFRTSFASGKAVEEYARKLGLKTGDGDDWVRVGPLKIVVDGGIHWGNTYLREPYGEKRARFYVLDDPRYRGDLHYDVERMADIFRAAHRLGWQLCTHVTGDAGVDRVLDALEAAEKDEPGIVNRRFSLTHAYFPATDSARRAHALGVGLDTQPNLYYKDSRAIAAIYGEDWAARFTGVGEWLRAGVPTALAGDHMVGLDPNTAMNAYNPFLMLHVAVVRKNREGKTYGPEQKVGRIEALRCVTNHPAWLEFTEDRKGSLEPGKFADLAVLDRDYLACPEEEIKEIGVVLTMVDGRVVYQKAEGGQQ
ncbi:MAG: amidohydrolase [Planctomycetales bacterium]